MAPTNTDTEAAWAKTVNTPPPEDGGLRLGGTVPTKPPDPHLGETAPTLLGDTPLPGPDALADPHARTLVTPPPDDGLPGRTHAAPPLGEGQDAVGTLIAPSGQLPFGGVPSSSAGDGERIGRYAIERELARGGMGVVYVARDVAKHLAYSVDGRLIALAGRGAVARIHDRDGKLLEVLEGHTGGVLSLAFSRDGSRLATGSRDTTVRLWGGEGYKPQKGPERCGTASPSSRACC